MDFSLTEPQTVLAGLAREILAERDTRERQWADLAAAGVLAAGLPEAAGGVALGGAGLGFLEQCSVLGEIGRAVSPVPYLASIMLGAGAIAEFGSPAQRRRWAAPAGAGDVLLTAALAEEDGDDPSAPPAVRAERPGTDRAGRWRLSGVKTAVPAAPRADLLLVPASTADGVLVFLVSPADEGVTVQPQELTDGPDAGRLVLDGVALDQDRVLGVAGHGLPEHGRAAADWLMARATVGVCATQAGVLERALELTAEYARGREQFGRPIGSFQAVAQRLADAYIDVEAVRLTMWQAAWLLASGSPDDPEVAAAVATAKFWAADAGHRVAHTAVHVHGGVGIDLSYPLHRYFVAATRAEFALGGATAQLRRLGDILAGALPSYELVISSRLLAAGDYRAWHDRAWHDSGTDGPVVAALVIGGMFLLGMVGAAGYAARTLPAGARVPLNAGMPEHSVWLSKPAALAAWLGAGAVTFAVFASLTFSLSANWAQSMQIALLPCAMLVVLAAEAGAVITARRASSGLGVAPEGGDGNGVDVAAEGIRALAEMQDDASGEPVT